MYFAGVCLAACGSSGDTFERDASSSRDSSQDANTAADAGDDAALDAGQDAGTGAPIACESSADCPPNTACTVEPNNATNQLDQRCRPVVGTLPNGAECTSSSECQSGLECGGPFGQQRCTGPCDVANQFGCVAGTVCYPNIIYETFGSEFDSYSMCLSDLGSYQVCTHDGACPNMEACNLRFNSNRTAVEGRCVTYQAGDKRGGEVRTTNDECRTNGCLVGFGDPCFEMCRSSAGCAIPSTCTLAVPAGNGQGASSCEGS